MNTKQLIEERSAGILRIAFISNWNRSLEDILKCLGFVNTKAEYVFERERGVAVNVLQSILWKGLAFGTVLMSEAESASYAEQFINEYANEESKIYTNGNWVIYRSTNSFSFSGLTDATFDAGVIIVNKEHVACLWVEEED
jgi:hypothetical protein